MIKAEKCFIVDKEGMHIVVEYMTDRTLHYTAKEQSNVIVLSEDELYDLCLELKLKYDGAIDEFLKQKGLIKK